MQVNPISFSALQPFPSTFPFTSLLTAGQQRPAMAQVGLVAVSSEFFLLLSCFQSWGGEGCFLDTGQHGGGEDLL